MRTRARARWVAAEGRRQILLHEDWSGFPAGALNRDNSARGEYMAMLVPSNPGGWYHNSIAYGGPDRHHSPLKVEKTKTGARLVVPDKIRAWGPALVLTRGEELWRDFEATTRVVVQGRTPIGLAARYRTVRDFYAAVFEAGQFRLVRMLEGTVIVLAFRRMKPGRRPVRLTLVVEGDHITARVGGVRLSARDGSIPSGGIGLWTGGGAAFGAVTVTAGRAEARRIAAEKAGRAAAIMRERRRFSPMELLTQVDVRRHALGRQIRFADLDGDGREEILLAIHALHKGREWTYQKLARLSALDLEGRVLWERGRAEESSASISCDLPFQAADRGNGMEVVACFASSIEVLDPRTGETRRRALTPKPPHMEPYWDEINLYWGDGHGDDVPRLLPDSLRLCNLRGRHPFGDILIKDRYHNAWALDGRTFRVRWLHRCNTGHYPYTCDLNRDGRDEVIMGYSRLDSRGRLIGRLYLGDHPDACFCYVDEDGVRHIMHPCGEAGFVDERNDGGLVEVHLGHVQHLSVANFVPELPDLERIIITYHGNEGIIVLMDKDDRLLRKTERYAAGSVCQPVNWTGDGRELIAFSPRHGDGGVWNAHFDLVVPFPNDDRPGKYMEVRDVLGWGVDQLVVWDEDRLHVYGPKDRPRQGRRAYRPIRPRTNLSNYQVNYSLPHWA